MIAILRSDCAFARGLVGAIACGLILFSGCKSMAKPDANAVFGPSPRRTTLEDAANATAIADAEDLAGQSPIELVGGTNASTDDAATVDDTEIFNATVVARANGAPIFAGEVLERYGEYLRQIRPKVSDEDYVKVRDEIIRRDLRGHIQKHLLVERTKGELKPEQLKGLQASLDKMFEQEVERLKKELKVSTRTELERELNNRSTSLNDVRNSFVTQGIARGYIEARAEKPKVTGLPDVREYYQSHVDEYKIPARVRWRQIQISHASVGGRLHAQEKLREAKAELDRGVPFEKVVAKYSDGPTAKEKGERDWTNQGSLADEKLDKLLFSMKVKSDITEHLGNESCQLVQVLERESAGVRPFTEVQGEIFQKLQPAGPANVQELIEKVYADAVIETKYDYDGRQKNA